MRLHQGTLAQYLLQGLIEVCRDFPRVLGRQVGPHRVLLATDHDADRMLLRGHLWPPLSRACSSRNVSRCINSCTRERAPSTRCRSALFSDSSSEFFTGLPRVFSSASAFWARERHPASSSARSRSIASRASRFSSMYAKLVLQRLQHPAEQRVDLPLREGTPGIAERAAPRDAARACRECRPTILIEHVQGFEQRAPRGPLAPQHAFDLGGAHRGRYHQRHVAHHSRLRRQRLIPRSRLYSDVNADLETEERPCPPRCISFQRARAAPRLTVLRCNPSRPVRGPLDRGRRSRRPYS